MAPLRSPCSESNRLNEDRRGVVFAAQHAGSEAFVALMHLAIRGSWRSIVLDCAPLGGPRGLPTSTTRRISQDPTEESHFGATARLSCRAPTRKIWKLPGDAPRHLKLKRPYPLQLPPAAHWRVPLGHATFAETKPRRAGPATRYDNSLGSSTIGVPCCGGTAMPLATTPIEVSVAIRLHAYRSV